MLGDLLKREQLCAAESPTAFAGATGSERLHDAPEGIECHAHIGRMRHAVGVRVWHFASHDNIVNYMGFNIS